MARHPSSTPSLQAALRLVRPPGRCCARSRPADFAEWSEVRLRNEAWLTPWEPRRPAGAARPDDRTATRSPPAARPATATRTPASAYGFGVFVDNALRRRDQPQQRPPRRDAVGARSATGSTRRRAGQSFIAEGVVVRRRVRLRAAPPAPPRDLHRAAQQQQPPGDGEAGDPRGGRRRSASWRSTACGRTTSATGSPSRSGRAREAELPRALALTACGSRSGRLRLAGEAGRPRPSPGASWCAASTSSSSSGACVRAWPALSLARSGSWWCAGFHAAPGLVHVGGVEPGADLVGHARQLDVDAMPLAVGVGPQLLLRRQRHLGGAMSLAHRATSSLRLIERCIRW